MIGHSSSTSGKAAIPLADAVIEQAIGWFVLLAAGNHSTQDENGFQHWLAAHPDHALAWQRLQNMGGRLREGTSAVAPSVARSALAQAAIHPRRRALKTLLWTGVGGTGLYLAQSQIPWRNQLAALNADLRTATGEQREVVLADGSRLLLNTSTAVDIRFDGQRRLLHLQYGEIMVTTARDAAARPFVVTTGDGSVTPLGTRFTVRRDEPDQRDDGVTRLAVSEGAVRIVPAAADTELVVHAGQQTRFTRHGISAPAPLDALAQSWIDGMLIAESTRLGELVAELNRYHRGRLRCDPAVADLRITGAWPLRGNSNAGNVGDSVLASLERHLPVRIQRLTRYWVTVMPR